MGKAVLVGKKKSNLKISFRSLLRCYHAEVNALLTYSLTGVTCLISPNSVHSNCIYNIKRHGFMILCLDVHNSPGKNAVSSKKESHK